MKLPLYPAVLGAVKKFTYTILPVPLRLLIAVLQLRMAKLFLNKGLLTALAFLLLNSGSSLARSAPWDIEKLPTTKAPAFVLADSTGKSRSSTDLSGQVLLINFWATWCAPCRAEMSDLDALQNQFKNKGLTVIGISIDEDLNLVKKFTEDAKLKFLILHDPKLTCHDDYKVFTYPTTFLVDQQGTIQKYWIGPQEWNSEEFKHTLQKYLP